MRLVMSRFGVTGFMQRFGNTIGSNKQTRIILLIAILVMSSQSKAWIAYGFKSGMSRFDVIRNLSDNESLVITDGAQQTYAGPEDNKAKYNLVYCSKPQKLYLMQFSLDDSLEVFVKTKEKYEKRYGEPTPLDNKSDYWESEHWENVDISFIWDLNESETILLKHNKKGTSAEFQDLSVCK
jgi:hypothetical protein